MDALFKNRVFIIVAALWLAAFIYFGVRAVSGGEARPDYAAFAGLDEVRHAAATADKKKAASTVKRDIFRSLVFVAPKPVVAIKPVVVTEAPKPEAAVAVFARESRFMGYLESDKKSVFLSHGEEVFIVKAGDKITGNFVLKEVAPSGLTIADAVSGDSATIPIAEK